MARGHGHLNEQRPFLISATNHPWNPVHDFVGRETEINALLESLDPRDTGPAPAGNVAVIHGADGVGKTELARVVADRLRAKFPDARLAIRYSNAGDGTLAVQHVLETVVHALDPLAPLPDNLDELGTLYRSLLEGQRVLVMVDQVGDDQRIDLLVPPPTCALLLTGRHPFDLPAAFALHLDRLSPADAETLLGTICPTAGPNAPELARLCRDTPLALRLCAALFNQDRSLEIESHIRLLREQVEQAAAGKDRPEALAQVFLRQIYERLDTRSQEVFCQLGVFTDGFSQRAAAALANLDGSADEGIGHHLDTLCRWDLLAFDDATKLYGMHASARSFALEHLLEPSEARLRLAQHYANIAEDCAALAHRGSDGVLLSALIFDDHKRTIKQAWAWLQQQERTSPIIDALILRFYKITEALGRLRFFPERELIPQIKAALAAAERLDDRETVLSSLGNLGRTYYMLGQAQEALDHYEQHLGLARQRGNGGEESRIRRNIRLAQALLDESP